jgi:outer membrane lipoprotein-sorting protein
VCDRGAAAAVTGRIAIRGPICLLACILAAAPAAVMAQQQTDQPTTWTLKKALKQIDKATKDRRGITAEVQYEELYNSRTISGAGTIKVSFEGKVRADIGGNSPRTFIAVPPYLHLYRPVEEVAETFLMVSHPDMLAQYALLGFVPCGSALKKQYDLTLLEESALDGQPVLLFDLAPKSKAVAGTVSKIRLWIDQSTWMPARQLIYHKASGIQLTIRYLSVSPDGGLSEELFQPKWPAGTKLVTM